MQVRVLYLGVLKEIVSRERELVEVSDTARLVDLYALLQSRFPGLKAFSKSVALSINYEYSGLDTALKDGDEVALLPPVSGGTADSAATPGADHRTDHASLVCAPIQTEQIASSLKSPADGAITAFDGIVRDNSRGRRTLFLEYTAYEPMALKQMEELARQALAEYSIRDVRIVHRLGRLQIGDTSVYIAVASAHRAAAFDACRWIIDTLKKTVPIWKKEFFEDGAVWADGEPFPPNISVGDGGASK